MTWFIAFQCNVLKAFSYATGMTLAAYLKRVKVSPKITRSVSVMDTFPKQNSWVIRLNVTKRADLQMASSEGV
jgi:hypothetical protein